MEKGAGCPMNADVRNAIQAADTAAQYDNEAKRLLGNKLILAHILVRTVDEFRGEDPAVVAAYIEGEPRLGTVPAEPGRTNQAAGERLIGLNTESGEIHEGLVRFDIVCYVRTRDGLSQIIVNLEAQKDAPTAYAILNRATFYVCRLVSSQKERDFTHTNYDDIKRVFSIWICMNQEEDSITYVHMSSESLLGSQRWPGKLDLLNIVLVGLSRQLPEQAQQHELHRLLGALFSAELSASEKLAIMEKEYNIPTTGSIGEGVNAMCNLSQGILERGEARGLAKGRTEGFAKGEAKRNTDIILRMHRRGYTLEQIADVLEKSLDEVAETIRKTKTN